jgi:hypothetical protein
MDTDFVVTKSLEGILDHLNDHDIVSYGDHGATEDTTCGSQYSSNWHAGVKGNAFSRAWWTNIKPVPFLFFLANPHDRLLKLPLWFCCECVGCRLACKRSSRKHPRFWDPQTSTLTAFRKHPHLLGSENIHTHWVPQTSTLTGFRNGPGFGWFASEGKIPLVKSELNIPKVKADLYYTCN